MSVRWGWSALLLVVAALHLGAGWQGLAPSLVFAGAAVAAFLCLPLLRWRRVPTGLVVFALLMTGVVVAHQVARDPAADPADPLPVLLDLVPRLLTAARPAPATPELLAPGALLVFAVSLLVVLALLRGGRSLLAPVVGAALLYTCTALLTAGRADRAGLVAVALVALTALGWLVVDRLETGGRVLLGLPAVPVAAVAVLALALPPDDAFEPRELVEPPVSALGVANPLPQLASWAGLGDTELFRVRGPERAVRLVVLSDYSGATWQAASLYGPLGAVAAPDLPPGARGRGGGPGDHRRAARQLAAHRRPADVGHPGRRGGRPGLRLAGAARRAAARPDLPGARRARRAGRRRPARRGRAGRRAGAALPGAARVAVLAGRVRAAGGEERAHAVRAGGGDRAGGQAGACARRAGAGRVVVRAPGAVPVRRAR
ncbi:hypothetical protein Q5530_00950 [Saccharothrix sp. BKS2]|uniref:hypothetical protein n=1 Tax=Saccharothrix sp. BKS2 TaxID=3064400 RepID=UPI0039ED6E12